MEPSSIPVFLEALHPCPYVRDKECSNLRFMMEGATPEFVDLLLERGFRHFGEDFFRPACPGCKLCEGIRIPLAQFAPNRSQLRSLKNNQDLELSWGPVQVDTERLELINRFQASRSLSHGWDLHWYSAQQYESSFQWDPSIMRELAVRTTDGRLVAVGILDMGLRSLSGVYHYHDPHEKARGLGTWLILQEILWGQTHSKDWLYLGLWNGSCPSLSYKQNFKPHQRMTAEDGWINT